MKFMQEITEWKDGSTSNHLYVLDDSKDKMIAFRAVGTKEFKTFKAPIRIELRGRKFVEVGNTFGYVAPITVAIVPTWQVTGSKGEVYTVSKEDNGYTCSCSGFRFRGKCKHIDQIQNKVAA